MCFRIRWRWGCRMHLRGAWFKYEALYPNGKRETLLSVPKYDFNWQTTYRFAAPKRHALARSAPF